MHFGGGIATQIRAVGRSAVRRPSDPHGSGKFHKSINKSSATLRHTSFLHGKGLTPFDLASSDNRSRVDMLCFRPTVDNFPNIWRSFHAYKTLARCYMASDNVCVKIRIYYFGCVFLYIPPTMTQHRSFIIIFIIIYEKEFISDIGVQYDNNILCIQIGSRVVHVFYNSCFKSSYRWTDEQRYAAFFLERLMHYSFCVFKL